jgi:predicted DNA-binding protein (UPF0251 family)
MEKQSKPPVERLAYNQREAAEAMGVSVSHFKSNMRPYVKAVYLGGLVRFPVDLLRRWLELNADAWADYFVPGYTREMARKAPRDERRLACSQAEAAAALGISVPTFRRHVRPDVTPSRIGGRTVYSLGELRRYLDRQAKKPKPSGR